MPNQNFIDQAITFYSSSNKAVKLSIIIGIISSTLMILGIGIASHRAEQARIQEQERLATIRAEQKRLDAIRAEQERLAAIKAEQERLAPLIANNRIKYLDECKHVVGLGDVHLTYPHPRSEYQCPAYVEKKLKRDANRRARWKELDRHFEQKARGYPSTRNYSSRQKAYEDSNRNFYQNASPNMRPERYR